VLAPVLEATPKLKGGIELLQVFGVSQGEVGTLFEESYKSAIGTLADTQDRLVWVVNGDDVPIVPQPGAKVAETQYPGRTDPDNS